MTGWRDLDDMRQPLPLDDWTADRLLAGLVEPDDAPPGYAGLARVLGQARGPVEAGELAGLELIVAAVTAAVADASPPTISTSPRRKSMFSKLLGAKLAAATMTTALLATGAAAATGSLPAPAQAVVSDAADAVGVHVPDAADQEARTAEREAAKAERDADRAARKAAHEADVAEREAGEDAGDAPVVTGHDEDVSGAEHGIGKGDPQSQAGNVAHDRRDTHLGQVAERQADHGTDPAGEDDGTPAASQADEARAQREARLGLLEEQKAARDAEKAQRPADEGDEAADEADDESDADEDADEDESEEDEDEDESDEDESDADEDEDEDDPAV